MRGNGLGGPKQSILVRRGRRTSADLTMTRTRPVCTKISPCLVSIFRSCHDLMDWSRIVRTVCEVIGRGQTQEGCPNRAPSHVNPVRFYHADMRS